MKFLTPKYCTLLGVAIASCVFAAHGKVMMKTPTTEINPQEVILTPEEIARLPCSREIRAKATDFLGLVNDVEIVTRHPVYGYVFRYSAGPLDNKNGFGGVAFGRQFKDTYIIWTADCSSFRAEFNPGFTLPAPSSG